MSGMARKRRTPHVPKLPSVQRILDARPEARHRRAAGAAPRPAPPPPVRSHRTAPAAPRRTAREEIARRPSTARLSGSDTPARRGGVETGKGRVLARNYPAASESAKTRIAQRSPYPTREQLARRQPMGQPHHDERAALLARSSSYDKRGRAAGRAQRPASRLPTADPAAGVKPIEKGRRHPELSGRDFAQRFFS